MLQLLKKLLLYSTIIILELLIAWGLSLLWQPLGFISATAFLLLDVPLEETISKYFK